MRRVLARAFLFVGLILIPIVPAFAGKHRDFPNSSNGSNPPNACPADSPTPFLAALNGTVAPSTVTIQAISGFNGQVTVTCSGL
jgi:hypothetical protein